MSLNKKIKNGETKVREEAVLSDSFSLAPQILTSKRGEYIEALKFIIPYRIISFTYPSKAIQLFHDEQIELIVHTKHKNKYYPPNWTVKTNNKIHAKLAIGYKGIYLGSWNMSENSTQNMHEIGIVIPAKKHEWYLDQYMKIQKYFTSVWTR